MLYRIIISCLIFCAGFSAHSVHTQVQTKKYALEPSNEWNNKAHMFMRHAQVKNARMLFWHVVHGSNNPKHFAVIQSTEDGQRKLNLYHRNPLYDEVIALSLLEQLTIYQADVMISYSLIPFGLSWLMQQPFFLSARNKASLTTVSRAFIVGGFAVSLVAFWLGGKAILAHKKIIALCKNEAEVSGSSAQRCPPEFSTTDFDLVYQLAPHAYAADTFFNNQNQTINSSSDPISDLIRFLISSATYHTATKDESQEIKSPLCPIYYVDNQGMPYKIVNHSSAKEGLEHQGI